jgi:hypothetical protein
MLQTGYLTLLVFGFPAGIISLLLSALGIWKRWWWLLIVAGLFTITETIYHTLITGLPLYLMALLQFYGAYMVGKGKPRLAWALLIPLLIFTSIFAYYTIRNLLAAAH